MVGRFGLQQARRCCVDEVPRNDAQRAPRSIFSASPLDGLTLDFDGGQACRQGARREGGAEGKLCWEPSRRSAADALVLVLRAGHVALCAAQLQLLVRVCCLRGHQPLVSAPVVSRASRLSHISMQHVSSMWSHTHTIQYPYTIQIHRYTPRVAVATLRPRRGGLCFMFLYSFIVFICMYIVYANGAVQRTLRDY
eukprot:scaffold13589_cov130-Isochrysis_galbana.AAC.2